MELVLASASLRRQQLLRDFGISFKICAPDVDESRLRGEPADTYVERLARAKAFSAAKRLKLIPQGSHRDVTFRSNKSRDWAVLGADTVVVLRQSVLGKPTSERDAVRMLKSLSGKTHEVITGYCWMGHRHSKIRIHVGNVRTKVTFSKMSLDFWKWYVSTGEPMDKAGSYAAQGIGMAFIEKVSGSYSNVIGLPLPDVAQSFEKLFEEELRECFGKTE